MGDRLDQGKTVFTASDFAFEQGWKTLRGCLGFRQMPHQPIQRPMVVFNHLMQPQRQPRERQLMTAQYQLIVTCKRFEFFT